jgi:hypothetical protein
MIHRTAVLITILSSPAGMGLAQQEAPGAVSPEDASVQDDAPDEARQSPGRFHLGPLYLIPYIRVGSIGFDSNVLYTPTERQPDFSISGGPGLELALPIRQASRLTVDGGVSYLYYAQTESQRRLNKYASALLAYDPFEYAPPTTEAVDEYRPQRRAWIRESYEDTNSRINLELDERVPRILEGTSADLLLPIFGRLAIQANGLREHSEVKEEARYLGNDLQKTLNKNRYLVGGALRYSVTIKTTLVAQAEQEFHRYEVDPDRDGDIARLMGGIETDRTALISGHALAGVGRFRPTDGGPDRDSTEVDIDATINFTPRTRLGGVYRQGLTLSVLSTPADEPTVFTRVGELRIEKDLWDRFDLQMYGRLTHLTTDGPVAILQPDGTLVVQERDDRSRQAGLNFGYTFRPDVRVGVDVSYTTRESNFEYFGIEGLIVGFTVNYIP